jgi:hypothetical protein
VGIAEICIIILVVLIGLPILFRLLKALGPVIAVLVGIAVAIGLVVLAANLVGAMVSGAFELLFGPLGLLLVGGVAAFIGYRQWQKRQAERTVVFTDEKPKRAASRIEVGDDGEIVTLAELLDEGEEKKKRG